MPPERDLISVTFGEIRPLGKIVTAFGWRWPKVGRTDLVEHASLLVNVGQHLPISGQTLSTSPIFARWGRKRPNCGGTQPRLGPRSPLIHAQCEPQAAARRTSKLHRELSFVSRSANRGRCWPTWGQSWVCPASAPQAKTVWGRWNIAQIQALSALFRVKIRLVELRAGHVRSLESAS